MLNGYQTIIAQGSSEYIDRKSRFLGLAIPVRDEEEALNCLTQIRKKYYDARHNCWAYILGEDGKNERASDDGEPSGTAGRPILEVIRHAGLTFTLVIVTRYFGGTLLGTGGLVRAYTAAAEEAVANAGKAQFLLSDRIMVSADYSDIGKLQYLFSSDGIRIVNSNYSDRVIMTLLCRQEETEKLMKQITELTSGRAQVSAESAGYSRI